MGDVESKGPEFVVWGEWLCTVAGGCTSDCLAPGNPEGIHREGCGLEPYARLKDVMVAVQQKERRDAQTARGLDLISRYPTRVNALGAASREVRASGVALGFADFPTVVIGKDDGTRIYWSIDLVKEVEPVKVARRLRVEPGWSDGAWSAEDEAAARAEGEAVEPVVREVPIWKRADAVSPEAAVEFLLGPEECR